LANVALPRAAGPPGQAGSVAELAFVARGFGRLYRSAIEWSQRIAGAHITDEDWRPSFREMARFMDDVIEQVETTGPIFLADVEAGEKRVANGEVGVAVERVITIKVNLDGFEREFAKLKAKYGVVDDDA
jgi:hypothetical protein